MWRYLGELPQDGNGARVVGLYRVHGGSFAPKSRSVLTSYASLSEGMVGRHG